MAVTAGGTPYVESSDLVASYPATSLALPNKVDTKLDNAPTDNAQSGTTYTFVLADARQLVTATNASAKTFTIPPQSSVTWLTGTMIRVVNYGAGALTVNGGVGVTVTNTAATIAQYGAATAIRTGSNAWTLVPFTGGAGNADFSNTATGTYTDSGINYKYVTFTGSGTLTITTAGYADVLILGGGGSGATGDGGGGGGGGLIVQNVILTAGAKTVTVGAGAAGVGSSSIGITGSYSAIDYLVAVGGGGGGRTTAGLNGGSGGGGGGSGVTNQAGGAGITGQGNAGGASGTSTGRGAGGGGAGAAAATATLDA
jgi:hypothetical protein